MRILSGATALPTPTLSSSLPFSPSGVRTEAATGPAESFQATDAQRADALETRRNSAAVGEGVRSLGPAGSVASAEQQVARQGATARKVLGALEPRTEMGKVDPGTLILSDFFDERTGPSHGAIVENSSRDIGFPNKMQLNEAPTNKANEATSRYFSRLDNKQFTPQELREFTRDYVVNRQSGNLQSATEELNGLTEAGVKGTALNLSRGSGKAQIMDDLYERLRLGWDSTAHPQSTQVGERRVRKLAPALGVDAEAVLADKGDARAQLQKGLLGLIDEGTADQKVGQARQSYDKAVGDFEANGNSVVVAAANSGKVLRTMERDAKGVEVAPDFFKNVLANDQVTTVGATRNLGGSASIADYTNADPGIDIYANGSYGDSEGTSFATPRVASVMAELHRQHPNATSAEVETMMKEKLTGTLGDYGHWTKAPVLDETASRKFFSGAAAQ